MCILLQPPTTSSLLGPNILLSNLFSDILLLCFSRSIRDKVSHPYNTTGKNYVFFSIFIFKFLERMLRKTTKYL
jgi:hypothetical protein